MSEATWGQRGWASELHPTTPPLLPLFLCNRVPPSVQTEGLIPEEGEALVTPPYSLCLLPLPKEKDGYECLVSGEVRTLLRTGDAMPQAILEQLHLMSTMEEHGKGDRRAKKWLPKLERG